MGVVLPAAQATTTLWRTLAMLQPWVAANVTLMLEPEALTTFRMVRCAEPVATVSPPAEAAAGVMLAFEDAAVGVIVAMSDPSDEPHDGGDDQQDDEEVQQGVVHSVSPQREQAGGSDRSVTMWPETRHSSRTVKRGYSSA